MDVLIFSGQGASQQGIQLLQSALKHLLSESYAVRLVTAQTLRQEPWEQSTALIVFPGGRDLPYVEQLQGRANDRIKAYVEAGGRYLGICAGAYYASSFVEFELGTDLQVKGPRELAFYGGACKGAAFPGFVYDSEDGARDARLTFDNGSQSSVYWNGGGFFQPDHSSNSKVVATYADLPGTPPAIVLCQCGQGSALLSGVHPEHPRVQDASHSYDIFHSLLSTLGMIPRAEPDAQPLLPTPQYLCCHDYQTQLAAMQYLLSRLQIALGGSLTDQADTFAFPSHDAVEPTEFNVIVLDKPLASVDTSFNPKTYFARHRPRALGHPLLVADVVTSTQSLLDKNPRVVAALPDGTVSVAARQISGRGRGGNAWVSPLGSLMFSLVLKIPGSMAPQLVFLQYLFALSIVEALEPHVKLCLKWPNDIYADLGATAEPRYKKVGGILVNTLYHKGEFQIIIGCGLNVDNATPTLSINQLAALQSGSQAQRIDLETTLALILNEFDSTWSQFASSRSFAPFESRYLNHWIHGGQAITIEASGEQAVIESITLDHGLLRTRLISGPKAGMVVDLQPDGNSFDMLKGLIKTKT